MAFQIVQMVEGIPATIYTDSIEDAAQRLGLTFNGVETRTNLRPCLQGKPKIAGFVGPCYGGNVGGVDVIRYEDRAAYAEFSK
jgi:hypothetical protein